MTKIKNITLKKSKVRDVYTVARTVDTLKPKVGERLSPTAVQKFIDSSNYKVTITS